MQICMGCSDEWKLRDLRFLGVIRLGEPELGGLPDGASICLHVPLTQNEYQRTCCARKLCDVGGRYWVYHPFGGSTVVGKARHQR